MAKKKKSHVLWFMQLNSPEMALTHRQSKLNPRAQILHPQCGPCSPLIFGNGVNFILSSVQTMGGKYCKAHRYLHERRHIRLLKLFMWVRSGGKKRRVEDQLRGNALDDNSVYRVHSFFMAFPAFRGCPCSLLHGHCPSWKPSMATWLFLHGITLTLTLLLPSSTFKDDCEYTEPIWMS